MFRKRSRAFEAAQQAYWEALRADVHAPSGRRAGTIATAKRVHKRALLSSGRLPTSDLTACTAYMRVRSITQCQPKEGSQKKAAGALCRRRQGASGEGHQFKAQRAVYVRWKLGWRRKKLEASEASNRVKEHDERASHKAIAAAGAK